MDLLTLVELSLGSQAHSGVVNFNYLHELLVQIVLRLNSDSQLLQQQQLLAPTTSSPHHQTAAAAAQKLSPSYHDTSRHHDRQSTQQQQQQQPSPSPGHDGEESGSHQLQSLAAAPSSQQQQQQQQHTTTAVTGPGSTTSRAEPELSYASEVSLPPTVSSSTTPEHSKSLTQKGSGSISTQHRSRPPSYVGTVHDLNALERKLQSLETRVNSFESLGDMLERRASDKDSTPVKDMLNFTLLSNKINSTEEGLEKTSRILDELLGEVSGLSNMMGGYDNKLTDLKTALEEIDKTVSSSSSEAQKGITTLEERLNQLEAMRQATTSESPSDAFTAMVESLHKQFNGLQDSVDLLKAQMEDVQGSVVNTDQLAQQTAQLREKMEESDLSREKLSIGVDKMSGDLREMSELVKQLEASLSQKVNISDLSSLMPQSDSSDVSLMPKLVEIQNRLHQLEAGINKQPSLPADLVERITAMQNAIDHLSTEISRLSSGKGSGNMTRVEEMGAQLSQLRDRIEDIDRALSALTSAVSTLQQTSDEEIDHDASKFADMASIVALQQMVASQQERLDRLLSTVANLSHEQEVDKEHIKALYSAVDELKAVKADKEQVLMEVEEKADRRALEGKASREWVDSTFERLDREIREARSHLLGQEEAFKTAVTQINEDVESKLDRMELEPLKEYFDKRLARVKTAPVCVQEPVGDDAAGFRKPLRFHCISCDKPLGLKPTDVVPSLPQVAILPSNKSLRPYTTYELELIRRSQKIGFVGYASRGVVDHYPSSIRAVGGVHTVTRPHQKVRVTPLSAPYNPDSSQPMARSAVTGTNPPRPSMYPRTADEVDIIGQDGHIYKGRTPPRPLPPLVKSKQAYGSRVLSSRVRHVVSPPVP